MRVKVSGMFCAVAALYADTYHLLEYKTKPKLPSILHKIPGVEYLIPPLKAYYYELLGKMEKLENDKLFISRIFLDVADAFSRLNFSFANRESIIEPFATKALGLYIKNEREEENDEDLTRIAVA